MKRQLSESQIAENKVIEMIHGLDASILEKEVMFTAVRDYGDLRFEEGDEQGWDNGFQAALNSRGAMG
jgi:hypothetical protein